MSSIPSTQLQINKELQSFFPEVESFPMEIAKIVLDNLNGIELCKMQRVSRTWYVVIQTFYHEKILNAKLFYEISETNWLPIPHISTIKEIVRKHLII